VKRYSESGMNLKTGSFISMSEGIRLPRSFFIRDVLHVAPELLGKYLVIRVENNGLQSFMITETEAYRGPEDKACHASKGRTSRTEIMYQQGGKIYVYFVYGMYWMLNFVAGEENNPQAVLIRGIEGFRGPGKLARAIRIDKSFYGEDLTDSNRIWVEDMGLTLSVKTGERIGIDYAGENWKNKPWRYYIEL
jgi:DNA-3-methyladenine glycosylase